MIDAPRYEIFTHSFSFSLRQTHKREICCQQTNRQNFATFQNWLVWDVWSFSPIPVFLSWNQCQCHRDGNVACLVVLLVTTLVRGLVGASGLPGAYNRKYMSWARKKSIFGFILHILTCTTCLVVVIRRLSRQKLCIFGLWPFSLVSNRELLQKKPSSDTWKKRG